MGLEPLHPEEAELHRDLRNALNEGLTSTDFLVWITVEPTGATGRFEDLPKLVEDTDAWLKARDPDRVDGSDLPELTLEDRAAEVRIRAVPKKPEARGRRSGEIVGNPEPVLVGWL